MLARERILGALRPALRETPWSAISVAEVAARSGVSRQTVYNEFGSRSGLMQAYLAEAIAGLIAETVPGAASTARADARAGLYEGFRAFFDAVAGEPLVVRLERTDPSVLGDPLDSREFVDEAVTLLAAAYRAEWEKVTEAESVLLARAVVRLCLAYLVLPPAADTDPADELATLLAPWLERLS